MKLGEPQEIRQFAKRLESYVMSLRHVDADHRENQVLEAASQALASYVDLAKAAAVSALWNYFVSELCQSASQNLSKKDGAV